jgi:putative endonuclease
MEKGGCVYIMTNKRNGTLVTARLKERTWEHKTGFHPDSFTAKYGCNMLVYYRPFMSIEEAIAEEKRIKGGNRAQKLRLIESINPEWKDLWDEIQGW